MLTSANSSADDSNRAVASRLTSRMRLCESHTTMATLIWLTTCRECSAAPARSAGALQAVGQAVDLLIQLCDLAGFARREPFML